MKLNVRARIGQYSMELLIVFVGVWLGLLADNYREVRRERAEEAVSLARLLRDLEADRRDMIGNLDRARAGRDAAVWLLAHADSAWVDADTLGSYLSQLQYRSVLVENASEYTALKSAGRINIIHDKNVRQEITQLYEGYKFLNQLHTDEWTALRKGMEGVVPYIRPTTDDRTGFIGVRVLGEAGRIIGEPSFLFQVGQLATTRGVLVQAYEERLGTIGELQEAISQALGGERGR